VTFNSSNRHTIVLKGRSFERASLPGIYHFSNHHLSLLDRAIFSRSIQTLQQSISSHHALSFAPTRDSRAIPATYSPIGQWLAILFRFLSFSSAHQP